MNSAIIAAGLIAITVPMSVSAKDKANAGPAKEAGGKIVCRTEEATGSRLNRRKRCMMTHEWEEARRLDRLSIERLQANRYNGNEYNGGPGGP